MKRINNEYYVSFEIAKLLKKLGFDWDTYNAYNKDGVFADKNRSLITWNHFSDYYSAPTLEVAQRWLREKHEWHINVTFCPSNMQIEKDYYEVMITKYNHLPTDNIIHYSNTLDNGNENIKFQTHEEAQEAGIKKALEIILEEEE